MRYRRSGRSGRSGRRGLTEAIVVLAAIAMVLIGYMAFYDVFWNIHAMKEARYSEWKMQREMDKYRANGSWDYDDGRGGGSFTLPDLQNLQGMEY